MIWGYPYDSGVAPNWCRIYFHRMESLFMSHEEIIDWFRKVDVLGLE